MLKGNLLVVAQWVDSSCGVVVVVARIGIQQQFVETVGLLSIGEQIGWRAIALIALNESGCWRLVGGILGGGNPGRGL